MVVVPSMMPVRIPVALSIVAMVVSLLYQWPPDVALVKVLVRLSQALKIPVMGAGSALTVTGRTTAVQPGVV